MRAVTSGSGLILAVFAGLLVARVLAIWAVYFWEEDEIALALGGAALVADTAGDLYRYTVQVGYYRLVQLVDVLLGGRIDLIPAIVKGMSALAGAVIPAAGFFAFRDELSVRERWLVVLTLAVNPIIWKSSAYGNSAIVATAMATTSLVVLSNRPGPALRVAALALFGLATTVRADTVLLAPVVPLLLWRNEGSFGGALKWSVAFGIAMALVYAAILALDPRADSALGAVARHMASSRPTMFWEYLLWAMSPVPLMLSIWGMRGLLETRPRLLLLLLVWALPVLLFYFRATTTPRYFTSPAVPLAIAAAVGMSDLATRLRAWLRPALASTAVIGLASLHLFLALGRLQSDWLTQPLYGATFDTHDGPMPTGALLYSTYSDAGSLARSLPHPEFGRPGSPYFEPTSFRRAMEVLADPAAARRTVLVVIDGGWGHAFHWHAHVAGARYTSEPRPGREFWSREIWLELGNTRVMTVARWWDDYDSLARFDVQAGDQVWVLGIRPFPEPADLAKLPPGLDLVPVEGFDSHIRTFAVTGRQPSDR